MQKRQFVSFSCSFDKHVKGIIREKPVNVRERNLKMQNGLYVNKIDYYQSFNFSWKDEYSIVFNIFVIHVSSYYKCFTVFNI